MNVDNNLASPSPAVDESQVYIIWNSAGKVLVLSASSTYDLQGIQDLGEESFSTPAMCRSGMVFRTYNHLMLLGNIQNIPNSF